MPMKKGNLTEQERADQILRMVRFGDYLLKLRTELGKTIKDVADNLSLSPTYLSEIERGLKAPSDYLVREIAEFYGVNESEIFARLGRIPLTILEDFSEFEPLQLLFERISTDKSDLSDDQRNEIYHKLFLAYQRIIEEEEENKQ